MNERKKKIYIYIERERENERWRKKGGVGGHGGERRKGRKGNQKKPGTDVREERARLDFVWRRMFRFQDALDPFTINSGKSNS